MFYRRCKRRRESELRRLANMRVAKERKRLAEADAAIEVGMIQFSGLMFGGEHILRCLSRSEKNHLLIEIDGRPHKPRTLRGLLALIAKRLI